MKHISVLSLEHISYQYSDSAQTLFSNISVSFPLGWTAVVGDNGIGKTTLMRIVSGMSEPTEGNVIPNPRTLICGYCEQTTDASAPNLDDFAQDWSTETLEIRRSLDIGDDWPWRYDTLSGGERKRLQLACALALHPDVLIFDEPSNHVDTHTRKNIAQAMHQFARIGILVSHDIDLMDSTVQQCVFLQRQHVNGINKTMAISRAGNYTQAHQQLVSEAASADSSLNHAMLEVQRLRKTKTMRDQRVQHLEALKDGRHIDRKDHDALSKHKLAKMSSSDFKASQASLRISDRVQRAQSDAAHIVTATKRYDGDIWFNTQPSHRKELIHIPSGLIAFDPQNTPTSTNSAEIPGIEIPTISVGPRDHIGIDGDNGTGKTTIFKSMELQLKRAPLSDDEANNTHAYGNGVLVIDQEQSKEQITAIFETIRLLNKDQYSQLCSSLAQLNADPERMLNNEQPSAGEVRKLQLCLGSLQRPQLIMMDEPTNHLDLHSVESLARVLKAFPGTVIVISHNEHFLSHVGDIRWHTARTQPNRSQLIVQ